MLCHVITEGKNKLEQTQSKLLQGQKVSSGLFKGKYRNRKVLTFTGLKSWISKMLQRKEITRY